MKNNLPENPVAKAGIYVVYGLLILPLSIILLMNKLISPLSPTVSFIDLESFQIH